MMDLNILKKKRLFLLDMDGTIYIEDRLFSDCKNFLNYIKAQGGNYIFITNNSSKSVGDYITKLNSMGIEVNKNNFLTSSQATAILLKQKYFNKKIYVLGTESFKKELKSENLNIAEQYEEDIDCLVVGFDTELTYEKLVIACRLLLKDVNYIATNPDLVCPTTNGYVPDCGSICKILEIATQKKPIYIGKPNPSMVELAIQNTNFSKEETIIIGDRLYTDIACGMNAGVTTALVLTGETSISDIESTSFRPDYIFKDISNLYNIISNI